MFRGLYIHIPYCKRKCNYCSFFSKKSLCVENEYFSALLDEILSYKKDALTFDTVYIGGGTPSLLSFEQLEKLFQCLHDNFSFAEKAEISMELNPESVNEEYLKSLKKLGVNRISFGVQSFKNNELKLIGRLHNAEKAESIIRTAENYFDNINLDLIVGLPEQTLESFKETLKTALSLPITHISVYSLIVEEETPIYEMIKNGLILPTEDETISMYDFANDELFNHGYFRYEISNFAKKGFECKHNLNCWNFKEYIGVGASAHSFYKNERYSNPESLDNFSDEMKRIKYACEENDRICEYIMLALRTSKGIDKFIFKNTFNIDFDIIFKNVLSKEEIKKTCENMENIFKIKDEFIYVSNSIIVDFLEVL